MAGNPISLPFLYFKSGCYGGCYAGTIIQGVKNRQQLQKKLVFRVSLNESNARLIVPIVNTFFEFRVNEAAANS